MFYNKKSLASLIFNSINKTLEETSYVAVFNIKKINNKHLPKEDNNDLKMVQLFNLKQLKLEKVNNFLLSYVHTVDLNLKYLNLLENGGTNFLTAISNKCSYHEKLEKLAFSM
jgi:hypothetical protein